MDLLYYNNEVDKILWDITGDSTIAESELASIIETVATTIYQYDQKLSLKKLKLVVEFLIQQKYQKYYIYDMESKYNQVENTDNKNIDSDTKKKTVEKKSTNENIVSDTMSINASDLHDADLESPVAANYINSEVDKKTDKVELLTAQDLVSHRHDYPDTEYKDAVYIKRRTRVNEIKKIPQVEQKSAAWLAQRNECLTATAIAIALDEDPYKWPAHLLLDKCGRGEPFRENENVHHGKKYEQIGNMFYAFRNNINVGEYGLLQHTKYRFIGASPDGICDKTTYHDGKLSKLVGRLLEIKFPKTRKICTDGKLDGDICPHYYHIQVLTQLYVTGLDECDFLQCKMEEYDSWDDYVKDSNPNLPGLSKTTNLEKGCLIQLLPKKLAAGDPQECLFNSKYLYPSRLHMNNEEIEKWIANEVMNFHKHELSRDYLIDRVIYWRLAQVACHLIKSNTEWFESKIPILKQFWDYVEYYRTNPKKLDKLVVYINEVGGLKADGYEKTADIFARVHKDYMADNKKSKYTALYQEESQWRKIYKEKYAKYAKYNQFQEKKADFIKNKKQEFGKNKTVDKK